MYSARSNGKRHSLFTPTHRKSSAVADLLVTHNLKLRVVVMGAAAVGKTSLIRRLLHDTVPRMYEATVEDSYSVEYEVSGVSLTLDILDTSGAHSFPAMRKLSIEHADGFVLVCSLDSSSSWEEVKQLRQQILDERGQDIESNSLPIVVAANKCDIEEDKRQIDKVSKALAEMEVCFDWEKRYVDCSARDNINVSSIVRELLGQVHEVSKDDHFVRGRCWSAPERELNLHRKVVGHQAATTTGRGQDNCIAHDTVAAGIGKNIFIRRKSNSIFSPLLAAIFKNRERHDGNASHPI